MHKLKQFYLHYGNKRNILFLLVFLLFITSCCFFFTDMHLLFVKNIEHKNSKPLGKVQEVDSDVQFKSIDDSLWFYAKKDQNLFFGDKIKTEADSKVLIELFPDIKIRLEGESLVQILNINQKLLIDLKAGKIQISSEKNQEVYLMYGNKVLDYKIQRGTYLVNRPDSYGVSITEFVQQIDLEGIQTEDVFSKKINAVLDRIDKMDLPNENEGKKPKINHKISQDASNPGKTVLNPESKNENQDTNQFVQTSENFPNPENHKILIHAKSGKIKIQPVLICLKACRLKVSVLGTEVFNQIFREHQKPEYTYHFGNTENSRVEWKLNNEEGDGLIESDFELHPPDDVILKKAIEQQLPIEFMD